MKRTQATTTAAATPVAHDLFGALRQMLLRYRDRLLVIHDTDQHFYANCRTPGANGKAQFFAAVKVSGHRHAFHLMPVYEFPDLLAGISPGLKKRMQGKSCFNVDRWDDALLQELQALVDQSAARYAAEGRL